MPNRYIRESAIESERVNALSWQGEVFYRRLLNRVDDFGRFTANPALLRASIFPLQLEKVSEKEIVRLLAEAEGCGLLGTYEVEGKKFVLVGKWEKGRAKESKYPPPPENLCERLQTYVYKPKQGKADVPDSDPDSDSDPEARSPWILDHGLELPQKFQTQECLESAKLWLQYKKERNDRYKKTGLKAMLTEWSNEFSPEELVRSIQYSMAKNWKGVFKQTQGTLFNENPKEALAAKMRAHRGNPNHVEHVSACGQELIEFKDMLAKWKAMQ